MTIKFCVNSTLGQKKIFVAKHDTCTCKQRNFKWSKTIVGHEPHQGTSGRVQRTFKCLNVDPDFKRVDSYHADNHTKRVREKMKKRLHLLNQDFMEKDNEFTGRVLPPVLTLHQSAFTATPTHLMYIVTPENDGATRGTAKKSHCGLLRTAG